MSHINNKKIRHKRGAAILSLMLSAAIAAASTGCAGRSEGPAAPSAATAATKADGTESAPASEDKGDAGTTTSAPDSPVSDFLSGSAGGTDDAAGEKTQDTQDAQTGAGQNAPEAGQEEAGLSGTGTGTDTASAGTDGGSDASAAGSSFTLKEETLHEALEECTGWGQSAGSSLRSVTAATRLLCWANAAGTAGADAKALEAALREEVAGFSDDQVETMKSNWSSVSYNVSMILDDFEEVSGLLEDAGCVEAARDAAADPHAVDNWRVAEKALEAALKE